MCVIVVLELSSVVFMFMLLLLLSSVGTRSARVRHMQKRRSLDFDHFVIADTDGRIYYVCYLRVCVSV